MIPVRCSNGFHARVTPQRQGTHAVISIRGKSTLRNRVNKRDMWAGKREEFQDDTAIRAKVVAATPHPCEVSTAVLAWCAAAVFHIPRTVISMRRLRREILRCAVLEWKHSVGIVGTHRRFQANVCSAPPPSPAKWRSRGCNSASIESIRRKMVSSKSSIVLPKPIPDCGLMTAEAEPEPLDTKLSPA
jgi:hypothetical protein